MTTQRVEIDRWSYAYNTNYDPSGHTDLANAVTRAGITLGPNMNHRIYLDTIFNAGTLSTHGTL